MRAAILTLYRLRAPLFYGAAAILVANVVVLQLPLTRAVRSAWAALVIASLVTLLCSVLLAYLVPSQLQAKPALAVRAPVDGRWLALNSPASRVPSHGMRAYGQTYAIDLVYEPDDVSRPAFGGTAMRDPAEYPAHGQPVFAMIDGTVVRATVRQRDHRARSNLAGFIYLAAEGIVRQLAGAGPIVGNHVTIRSDTGVFATVGHLKRGSVSVSVGDQIAAGTVIGACGNSGNSSEPHVHAQLMDRASFWTAQGLPMLFSGVTLGDDPAQLDALPANGEHIISGPAGG